MKKSFCLLLAILMLFSFAACKKDEAEQNKEEKAIEDTVSNNPDAEIARVEVDINAMKKKAVEALNALPYTDLSQTNGITVAYASSSSFITESEDSSYNSSLTLRNQMFEKKFSTKLTVFSEDIDLVLESAYYDMLSGLEYTDLFCIPQKELGKFITKGVLLDIKALTDSDYSASYFNSSLMKNASAGRESYAIYGDFNNDPENYNCLYLNEALLAAGLDTPYKAVEGGDWTWDKLLEMCRISTAANGGSTSLSAYSASAFANISFKTAGLDYINSASGTIPSVGFASETSQRILELLRSFNSSCSFSYSEKTGNDVAADFAAGNSLFYAGKTSDIKKVKSLNGNWGIVPLPRHDGVSDNYYSYLSEDHPALCVYAGAESEDLFAAIAGLNAASSGGYLLQAYYKDLIYSYLPDSNTLNMLDYVFGLKNSVLINDFTDIHASRYSELYTYTRDAIASAASGNTVHIYMAEEEAKKKLDPILAEKFGY